MPDRVGSGNSASDVYRAAGISLRRFESANPAMLTLVDQARRAARTDLHILIEGENGTGKNFLAQAIHNASDRCDHPFVSVNCSTLAEALADSELFGHERGAFTGAERKHRGVFERAGEGTLFLDELSELPTVTQAKLLRIVEYRQFERVGGEQTLYARARLVCASSRRLSTLTDAGGFRRDLFRRLGEELVLRVPPLRERPEDLPRLVREFFDEWRLRHGRSDLSLSRAAEEQLLAFDWPGNLRQLRNTLKRGVALAGGDSVELGDLCLDAIEGSAAEGRSMRLADVEARHVQRALLLCNGNKKATAKLLDVARSTLDHKIRTYALEVPKRRDERS